MTGCAPGRALPLNLAVMLKRPYWTRILPAAAGVVALALGMLAGCGQDSAPESPRLQATPVGTPSPDANLAGPIRVEIATNKGVMRGDLYPDAAPVAVTSFVHLAEQEFFDGVIFHRILPGFVVQTGDPTGTGAGGPGYTFPDEPIPANLTYGRGTLAMANSGPNTNGSQFFICLADLNQRLPRNYTIFGQIDEGLEALAALASVGLTQNPATGELSKPTEPVIVESIRIQRP